MDSPSSPTGWGQLSLRSTDVEEERKIWLDWIVDSKEKTKRTTIKASQSFLTAAARPDGSSVFTPRQSSGGASRWLACFLPWKEEDQRRRGFGGAGTDGKRGSRLLGIQIRRHCRSIQEEQTKSLLRCWYRASYSGFATVQCQSMLRYCST